MRTTVVFSILLGLTATACGGGSSGPPDTGPMVPAGSCAQPGDVGNENGVGAFCTPGGAECSSHPLAGLCLATLSPADGQWFCTRLCTDDSMCGSNAVCTGDPRGRACVPAICAPPADDAGARDAGASTDASSASDAGASDAGSDAG